MNQSLFVSMIRKLSPMGRMAARSDASSVSKITAPTVREWRRGTVVLSILASLLSFGGVASADTWSGEWRIRADGVREVVRNPPTTDRVEPDALIGMMFSMGELRLRVAVCDGGENLGTNP